MFEKIRKRGEITTTQIVMIVVLIVSFIVIIYFFSRLNLGSTNNSEVCHNSVVLVSTGKGYVGSLDCSTDYVCVSGGGKCANFNPTTTVKVDATSKDAIMKAIADQMSACWYQFGEGNLNYGSTGLFPKGACALCSAVSFDNKILAENYDITYKDFYDYLNNTKKTSSETYLYYLYGVYDVSSLMGNKVIKDNLNKNILGSGTFDISTGYYNGLLWGAFNKKISPVSYVPTSQLSSELGCSNFITKA